MGSVTLVLGDITVQEVDAIVNAANSSLMGGGGVDGAIHRRGGPSILAACREIRSSLYRDGLPAGEAVATEAGDLPARWVIHTVGPVYGRTEDDASLLASCFSRSLEIADELGARSVAFPAISTGAFGYPLEEASEISIDAVLGRPTKVEEVRFVLFDRTSYDTFAAALESAGRER
jgi:O-acetyl-ADP-ribose deacetylase (regulator of RNase III)